MPGAPLAPQQLGPHLRLVPARIGILESTGDPTTMLQRKKGFYTIQLRSARDNGHLPILSPYCRFRQHRLCGPVRKYEEGAAAVGNGGKIVDRDSSNSVYTGDGVQGSVSDGADLRK